MTDAHPGNLESLRRVFHEGFSARDIADPLLSFDATTPASVAAAALTAAGCNIAGVRRGGLVVGYVECLALAAGDCAAALQPFANQTVVSQTAPLPEVMLGLKRHPRLFVQVLGEMGGVIDAHCLQKAPVRMWLFGMITLLEMRMAQMIDTLGAEATWRDYLSEARYQKAEEFLAERRRRGQNVRLVDCLQFADKGQIVARCELLRAQTRFTSRRQVEEAVKELQSLRNNLAHAQDIVSGDWNIILTLAEELDTLLAGRPPGNASA